MAYYSSETCGYPNSRWVGSGCTIYYAQSEVKYVVDAWKTASAPAAIEARLIKFDDLTENLGFELQQVNPTTEVYKYTLNTPSWVCNNYAYWTSSQYNDLADYIWYVSNDGSLGEQTISSFSVLVRPVITISKSAI